MGDQNIRVSTQWEHSITNLLGYAPTTEPGIALRQWVHDRTPSTTPGADPPRDAKDSGSARSHSMHLETSSSDRP